MLKNNKIITYVKKLTPKNVYKIANIIFTYSYSIINPS